MNKSVSWTWYKWYKFSITCLFLTLPVSSFFCVYGELVGYTGWGALTSSIVSHPNFYIWVKQQLESTYIINSLIHWLVFLKSFSVYASMYCEMAYCKENSFHSIFVKCQVTSNPQCFDIHLQLITTENGWLSSHGSISLVCRQLPLTKFYSAPRM